MFHTAAIIIAAAAVLSWINYKLIRLPSTIGVMVISLAASLVLVVFGERENEFRVVVAELLRGIDFNALVFHGMLPMLLFAGALHVKLDDLKNQWPAVMLLAFFGTAVSIVAVAVGLRQILPRLGVDVPWVQCFLFGALISPTDPVAVLGILKSAGAPKSIETQIAGEALFNDGVGVVAFTALLAVAGGEAMPTAGEAAMLMLREIGGGTLVGALVAAVGMLLLKRVDNYRIEVLLTLAVATGSYALAEALHESAAIAVVVAGLVIGNFGRRFALSAPTAVRVDDFWELIDEFLNIGLFLLIGLGVIVLPFHSASLWAGGAAIVVSLAARFAIVAGIVAALGVLRRRVTMGSVPVLTWGGLRGGVSLALALALPASEHREILLTAAYMVVVFSVVVEGLTFPWLIRRSCGNVQIATPR